jgi:hypothetical protein
MLMPRCSRGVLIDSATRRRKHRVVERCFAGGERAPMPRYFFHTEGKYMSIDAEGTELPDLKAVCAEAIRTAGEMLRDAGLRSCTDDPRNGKPWCLWITDGPGGAGKPRLSIHVLCRMVLPRSCHFSVLHEKTSSSSGSGAIALVRAYAAPPPLRGTGTSAGRRACAQRLQRKPQFLHADGGWSDSSRARKSR